MQRMIDFYNEQSTAFSEAIKENSKLEIEDFIDTNPAKISWTRALRRDANNSIQHKFKENEFNNGLYRPFTKQWLYFDKPFIESPGLNSMLFPNEKSKNIVINITGIGASKPFSVLISDKISSIDCIEKNQCFPLYYYEENKTHQANLFDISPFGGEGAYIRRDAISDFILERAKKQYGMTRGLNPLLKENIFYYVYGFLHSPKYRETFASDLKKMLPRLPLVDDVRDFWAFSKAGRALADLHLNYENISAHPDVRETQSDPFEHGQSINNEILYNHYYVTQMRFPAKDQKDKIIYNSHIYIENIPAEAYGYIVNGKSAIEWIMERYAVATHKESGITNNPNDWARENRNPRYIIDLLHSVINLSVQTVGIVKNLPDVEFGSEEDE